MIETWQYLSQNANVETFALGRFHSAAGQMAESASGAALVLKDAGRLGGIR
jgi:hypothetical protein